jgi:hypothetical protein
MLNFAHVFHSDSLNGQKPPPLRILGGNEDRFLFCLQKPPGCCIGTVSKDGIVSVLVSFTKPLDFVSGDVHQNFLHVTYRVLTKSGFTFFAILSVVNHSITQEFKSDVPVAAVFLPQEDGEKLQLLQLNGSKLTHYLVSVVRDRFVLEKLDIGLTFRTVSHFQYDRRKSKIWIISSSITGGTTLGEFRVVPFPPRNLSSFTIRLQETAVLPNELALFPLANIALPYYHWTNYNVFVARASGVVCVVQQLFEGVSSSCAFSVSTYPNCFERTLFVPGIGADLPLCFASFASIVVVFVPNYFLCIVDIAQFPPHIAFLPKQFAASVCGRCCTSAPIGNHIIDLDTAETYAVNFSFSSFALLKPIMTTAAWDVMANVSASLKNPLILKDFCHLLEMSNFGTMVNSVHSLFRFFGMILPPVMPARRVSMQNSRQELKSRIYSRRNTMPEEQLQAFEEHFPTANGASRRVLFQEFLEELLMRKVVKSVDTAIECALAEFHRQNEAVLLLRQAIDEWARQFGSDVLMQLLFGLLLQSECLLSKFPAIPSLKGETEPLVQTICSRPIVHRLAQSRVIDNICMKPEDAQEIARWRQRFPLPSADSRISVGRVSRLPKTRSVEYRSQSDPGEATVLAAWVAQPHMY